MEGKIRMVEWSREEWGFIEPDVVDRDIDRDPGDRDVYFCGDDFVAPSPIWEDRNRRVTFDFTTDSEGRRRAQHAQFIDTPPAAPYGFGTIPGRALTDWAVIPFFPFKSREGEFYSSVLEFLAKKALKEDWHFGEEPDEKRPYPILHNYLTYTFWRLKKEGNKILEKPPYAVFNTGLVDDLYRPVYAFF